LCTTLPKEDALNAWELVNIKKKWDADTYGKWVKFWTNGSIKAVNRDTWMLLLTFIEKVGNNASKYDTDAAWPSAYDDFVYDVLGKTD